MKKLILLPILFISLTSVAQTKLTIQSETAPTEKFATVQTLNRNDAYGDQECAAGLFDYGDSNFATTRSLLQFDLSSIPQGSFVNWARLSLEVANLSGSKTSSNATFLRRITSPWDPASVTWNTQPSTAMRGAVHLPEDTSFFCNSCLEAYKNINVWTLVQAMVDSPETSFGFELRADTDLRSHANRFITFVTPVVRGVHVRDMPKLVMEYTAPGLQQKVTTMSVDLIGSSKEMNIYPNPCNGIFNCNIKSAEAGNMFLKVIDMLGRIVYGQHVNTSSLQMRISLPASSAGTYFVVLQDTKSATIVSQELQVN